MLAFGPNGRLYFTMGDGGAGGDPENRAQNPRSLFGKLLSLNVATKGVRIEALGLRNAWRFSFDRANGDLYIGDVGQGEIEEVDYTPANSPGLENYGWDVYEGNSKFEDKAARPGQARDAGRARTATTKAARSPAATSTAARTRRCAAATSTATTAAGPSGASRSPAARPRPCGGRRSRSPASDLVRPGQRRRALRRLARRHDLPPDALNAICRTCATQFAEIERAAGRAARSARTSGSTSGSTVSSGRRSRSLPADHRCDVREDAGYLGVGIEPAIAIGQRLLLAETAEGNVLWDMIPLVDDAAVEAVRARGRGAGDRDLAPALLLRDGRVERRARRRPDPAPRGRPEWIMRPDPAIELWSGDEQELLGGPDAAAARRPLRGRDGPARRRREHAPRRRHRRW